ncbi:MAG: hypothetical protein JNN00_03855 [Chitinophagaceae bacterium]|nr:hypothetical protein [Chitinophagaceae bacterium]
MRRRKIISFFILLVSMGMSASAQQGKECGTPAPANKPVLTAAKLQRAENQRLLYTSPYPLKVFIRVFADDNGTNLAATEEDVLRQFENMRSFYNAHDICFILAGYEVTRHSDLNNMNIDEADDMADLEGYVLNGCMNIFVHAVLYGDDGTLNGNAYGIPNHFLSLVASAVSSTTNLSTMAHEMGHCLGLLHTFEDAYGEEAVTRSGSCRDCEDDGDLLCDTQADLDTDLVNASCVYTGSSLDECGVLYLCEETNIMTYGRRSCRDHFTNGQGARARTYVLDDHENRIAENALAIGNANLTVGTSIYAARNSIIFIASSFTVSLTATANFSSRSITFSPGVELKPLVGYVHARAGTYCQ